MIKRSGSDLTNRSTGATLRAILKADDASLFLQSADVAPGQVIENPADGKSYLVADVNDRPGHKLVFMFPSHHSATITRRSSHKDGFGRSTGHPVVIANEVPIILSSNRRRIILPIGTNIQAGDLLTFGSETFDVALVNNFYDWPGFISLVVVSSSCQPLHSSHG